jgi:hypothetical protein
MVFGVIQTGEVVATHTTVPDRPDEPRLTSFESGFEYAYRRWCLETAHRVLASRSGLLRTPPCIQKNLVNTHFFRLSDPPSTSVQFRACSQFVAVLTCISRVSTVVISAVVEMATLCARCDTNWVSLAFSRCAFVFRLFTCVLRLFTCYFVCSHHSRRSPSSRQDSTKAKQARPEHRLSSNEITHMQR